MHAVNAILRNTTITHLNIASNMISEVGLEIIIDNLIKSKYLKSLNLGVVPNSIRKNSLGKEGAKSIVNLILNNTYLEKLTLQDNDLGLKGGEFIGNALKKNKVIFMLKCNP